MKILFFAIILIIVGVGLYFFLTREPGLVVDGPQGTTSSPQPSISESPLPQISNSPPVIALPEIAYGNVSYEQVIFTFDAGAGTQSLDKILEVLERHKVKSTFFITGKWAEQNSELIESISSAGHEIFNHTYDHPHLTELNDVQIAQEFQKTEEIIKGLTGKSTKPYFRPPYGDRNKAVLDAAAEFGYQSVYWTTDALDWKEGITEAEVKARILNNLQPGAIYLMHVGDSITGNILDNVFTQIEKQGYRINSLTEGIR